MGNNGGGFPIEMENRHYNALANYDVDERAKRLEQIVGLYSKYMEDCRQLRDELTVAVEAVIFGD
jgi:hypothetical protein